MILFAYNFKHKKTQDFLFHCFHHNIKVDAVVAADFVDLGIPRKKYRSHIRVTGLIHPREICSNMKIPFYVAAHNSKECLEVLDMYEPHLGVVSGARILSKEVISKFKKGIINFHPGLIPEARGLDTTHWCIFDGVPLGVTSHFIDARVDAGRIIKINHLPVFRDDTLIDISLRLYEAQLDILKESIDLAIKLPLESFAEVPKGVKKSYKIFPSDCEDQLHFRLVQYLDRYAEVDEPGARSWYFHKSLAESNLSV